MNQGSARRSTVIAIEATANIRARWALSLSLVVLIAVGTMVVFVTEYEALVDTTRYELSLVEQGYATIVTQANGGVSDGVLTSQNCESVGEVPGVVAVVWVRDPAEARLHDQSGPQVFTWRLGGEVADLLRYTTSLSPGREWRGEAAVESVSGNGMRRAPTTARLYVNGVSSDPAATKGIPLSVARADLSLLGQAVSSSVVLLDGRSGPVEACFVVVSAPSRTAVLHAVRTMFPAEKQIASSWLLPETKPIISPADRHSMRPYKPLWLWIGALAGIWQMFALRLRRSERAVYRLVGFGRLRLVELLTLEYAMLVLLGALIACWSTILMLVGTDSINTLAMQAGAVGALRAVLFIGAVGASVVTMSELEEEGWIIAATKDR